MINLLESCANHVSTYTCTLIMFNIEAFLVAFLVVSYLKTYTVELFISSFLLARYALYYLFYVSDLGHVFEFLGSSIILTFASYVYARGLHVKFSEKYTSVLKAGTLILVVILLVLDNQVFSNISTPATVSYIVLLFSVIYYALLNEKVNYVLFLVFTVFVLMFSSDIREMVNLLWLQWDLHKCNLLLKEQFLVWVTAYIILHEKVSHNPRLLLSGSITIIVANLLQVPPIIYWVYAHNPHDIFSYLIRLSPLPFIFGLKPKNEVVEV